MAAPKPARRVRFHGAGTCGTGTRRAPKGVGDRWPLARRGRRGGDPGSEAPRVLQAQRSTVRTRWEQVQVRRAELRQGRTRGGRRRGTIRRICSSRDDARTGNVHKRQASSPRAVDASLLCSFSRGRGAIERKRSTVSDPSLSQLPAWRYHGGACGCEAWGRRRQACESSVLHHDGFACSNGRQSGQEA